VVSFTKNSPWQTAARVVQKRDQLGLHLAGALLHVGAHHGVGLPELVDVRLGEGQASLALHLCVRLEQLMRLHDAAEGIRGDALALQHALFDARAVEGRDVVRTVKASAHLLDGLEHVLRCHLAGADLRPQSGHETAMTTTGARLSTGREQQLIDAHGGVGNSGVANKIRGVRKGHPLGCFFHRQSDAHFGNIAPYTGY
jgi:hypothetical protein